MSRSKTIDLLSPNIGARAPAGNKNQSRPRAGLAGFDYPQRHAFANIHLSLAYSGSGVRAAGDAYACNNPGDQKDNGPRKHFHREGYSRADHRQRVACGSTKNPGRINVAPHTAQTITVASFRHMKRYFATTSGAADYSQPFPDCR